MSDETKSDAAILRRVERILAEAMCEPNSKLSYEKLVEAHSIVVNAPAIHNEGSAPSSTRIFGAMKGLVLHYEDDLHLPTTEIDEAREHAEYVLAHEKTLGPVLTHGHRILARGLLAALGRVDERRPQPEPAPPTWEFVDVLRGALKIIADDTRERSIAAVADRALEARPETAAIIRETEHGWWRQLLASLGLAMCRATNLDEVWDEFLQAWTVAGIGTSFPQGPGQENTTDPSAAGFERVGGLPMRGGDAMPSLAQVRGLASVDPPFFDDVPCPEAALEKIRDQYPRHHVAVTRCIKVRNETHSIHFICVRIDGGRPNTLLVLRDEHLDGVYSDPLTIAEVVHTMTNITQPERVVMERRVPGCFPPPACPDDRERLHQAMRAVTLDQLDAAANVENLASLLALVARTPSLLDAVLSHALEIRDAQPHDSLRDSDHPLVLRAMAVLHNETRPTPVEPQWVVNSSSELGVRVNGHFYFLYKGRCIQYERLLPGETPLLWRPVGKREFGECCRPALEWDRRFLDAIDEIRDRMLARERLNGPLDPYTEALRFAYEKIREGMRRPPGPFTAGDGWRSLSDLGPDEATPHPADFVGTPKP